MRPFLKFSGILFLILNFYFQAYSTTFEISPGEIIQDKINMMTAGDTLLVHTGVYFQKMLFNGINGNATQLTVVKADHGVVIDGTGLSPVDRQGLITIINSSFIKILGFELRNFTTAGGATPVGILIEGSGSNIRILNNKIHNIANNNGCADPCAEGAHGLGVFRTSTSGINDLLIQGNEVYNNVLQASEAFVINGNVSGFKILDNNVHNNNNIAFDFIGYESDVCGACTDENNRARNGIVRNNIAMNNSSFTNPWYTGNRSAAGFYVDGGKFIVFDKNISANNDFGFEFASEMPMKSTDSILMINNYIYDNTIAGLIMGGYDADNSQPGGGSSDYIYIYNNSFFNQQDETEIEFQNRVRNCRLANNIIYNKGTITNSFAESGVDNSDNVWGTNLWWGPDTSDHMGSLPGISIVMDPLWIDTMGRDLSISVNSPAKNAGIDQPALDGWNDNFWDGNLVTHGVMDINSEVRIEESIDLGAEEYNAIQSGYMQLLNNSIELNYNPFSNFVTLTGVLDDFDIQLLDASQQEIIDYPGYSSPLCIDISCLESGLHFLRVQSKTIPELNLQIIIKP